MNQNNGIVKWFSENGGEYTFWTHSDYIKDEYIYPYLKQIFPHRLIINEFNKIDYVIAEENIPIEVQSTNVHKGKASPQYSKFEQHIEKQIRQNINDTGICYLFFDSELLRAMESAKNRKGCNISINLDWLRKLMKEGKLKVFTVRYDGFIEEKKYKDFDFLSSVSQTCIVAAETDDIILNKNKIKIYTNVVKGYSFNQDELDKFDISWKNYCKEAKFIQKIDTKISFLIRNNDIRAKLYARILSAVGNLRYINDIMNRKYNPSAKSYASTLGIFDAEGGSSNYSRTMFVDKFDICKLFPGYIRNKEVWDNLKGKNLISLQFRFAINNKGYISSEAPDWYAKRAELDLKILDLLPRRQNEIWRKLGIKARVCSSILTRLEKEGKIKRTEAEHKTLFVERVDKMKKEVIHNEAKS